MRPDFITPCTRVLNQWLLGQALTGRAGLDVPIRSLFVYNANPMVVAPFGYWTTHAPGGATVSSVNSARFADLGRAPTFSDTAVQLSAA